MTDLFLNCGGIKLRPETVAEVYVEVYDIDEPDVLKQIDIGEAVTFYEPQALLDYIGRDMAVEYWNILEAEEA